MANTKKLFDLAELAEASYSKFNLFGNLENALTDNKFSQTQATEFAAHWSVASHQANTGSGFSATLFEDNTAAGNYTLAIRGTELPSDIFNDLYSADVGGVVLSGAAFSQIVDLYNYWQRLTTATTAHYTQAELVTTTSPPVNGYLQSYQLGNATLYVSLQFSNSLDFGLDELYPTAKVDVTGHSLGGHLAMAFARLFPDNTADLSTVNGAGFGGSLLDSFFNQLAGHATTFAKASENLNLFGEKGLEIITSDVIFNQYGIRAGVAIESATHSSSAVTDSLAVANLFIKLDASLANKTPAQALTILNVLFEKSSNKAETSLEKLVEGLSETILGSRPTIVTDDRESLYTAIYNLTDSATFQALIGKVTIAAPPTNASEARSDLGLFLSLYYLTPFALKTDGSIAADAQLTISHPDLATQFKDDKLLTPEQIANGEANFSDMYLADRAAMLSWLNKRNSKDAGLTLTTEGRVQGFQDIESETIILVGSGEIFDRSQYIFGSNSGADSLSGYNKGDHLYGMGGNDMLNGDNGNDWLEGGAGQDTLNGGDGQDILLGGKDVDILEGGTGNDTLKGGEGVDVYQFTGSYGTDVITDSDGQGFIIVDSNSMNSATKKFENIYKNEATGHIFTKLNGGTTLVLTKEGDPNRIIINDWSESNNLSISLTGSIPTAPAGNVMNGDFKKAIDDKGTPSESDDTFIMTEDGANNYTIDEENPYEYGALDLITGTAGTDVINGLGGSDALFGLGGDDWIEGGDGGDVLEGGLGKDTLIGGAGDDYIYGSSNGSISKPTDAEHIPPTNSYANAQGSGFNWISGHDASNVYSNGTPYGYLTDTVGRDRQADDAGNLMDGGAGNDLILAGTGADYVHGGADKDLIYGMDKDDILFGDGENDVIYGDGIKPSATSVHMAHCKRVRPTRADSLTGSSKADLLVGNDTPLGGAGSDWMFGGGALINAANDTNYENGLERIAA